MEESGRRKEKGGDRETDRNPGTARHTEAGMVSLVRMQTRAWSQVRKRKQEAGRTRTGGQTDAENRADFKNSKQKNPVSKKPKEKNYKIDIPAGRRGARTPSIPALGSQRQGDC